MGFLSIEPGPIFRQTYSRHTSASPDKRGVWTHAVQNATSNHCLPIRCGNPTIKRKNDSATPRPFPAARDSLYRRFHGRGMNPSRRTRIRRCRKTIPCTTIGQKTFHKDGTAVKQRSAFVDPANPSAYQIPHQRRAKRASPAVYHLYLPREGRQPVVKSTLGLSKPPKHKYPPKKEASEKFPRLLFI